MKTPSGSRVFQYSIRIFILAFATYLAVMHQLKGVLAAPNAHVYCPFGGLETLYKFLASGGYITKIMPATLILFVISLVSVIILNRAFCGWICPLGTLQMLSDRLARALGIKKVTVPPKIERFAQYLKYAGLIIILYFTWRVGDLVYAPYDPWAAYAHIAAGFEELYGEFLIGSIFLLVALLGSLWLPNNFCRYFCPMGAFLGIFSKLSPTRITRNEKTCINCKKCDGVCPAQLDISTTPEVKSPECFSCGDCAAVCPVKNTLNVQIQRKMSLTWFAYGIATLVIFFGSVEVAKLAGIWKTSYASATEALTGDSGAKNPELIRGSMTLKVVAEEFGVPAEAFIKHFNLPEATTPEMMLKEIAAANNLGTETFVEGVREFIMEEQGKHGETHTEKPVEPAALPIPEQATAPQAIASPQESAKTPVTVDIRGHTTMGELLSFGITKERFKEITGVEMPEDGAMTLKDFAAANGLDREAIKDQLIKAVQQ
ncbi:4Fe-4S ferredoxin iron-sulfur binding domain protein [Candidatus Moduliflexus flocculans]|uniref:4Fe-4S ferredoxin iron-sulfur binding domain protein n=1 Tax=Candidatus Moduliflexus flocculans TaxID=1499966 RepID=A0A081BTE9_9BACT|nr:4Fe-4S ferredoxin iron-sulfur binding domain protein [Candidatus Moduliflexus flocculans]